MAQQNPIDIIYQGAIQGKTQEQRENIAYMFNKPLVAGGCFSSAQYMTDEEYFRRINTKKQSLGLYGRAVEQIGLDPEELQEIPPVCLENFVFNDAWTKTTQSGMRVSSSYQVSWIFFSAEQIYLYQYTMYMDEDKKERIPRNTSIKMLQLLLQRVKVKKQKILMVQLLKLKQQN